MSDNFDSNKLENNIAPFLNILNDMYAKDISKKIKNAKHQRAKDGAFIGGVAPYGYKKAHDSKCRLVINEETAAVVRKIYDLALAGNGAVNIKKQLLSDKVIKPSVYNALKYHGKSLSDFKKPYEWNTTTILKILESRVYIGDMVGLQTETVNYKTKARVAVPIRVRNNPDDNSNFNPRAPYGARHLGAERKSEFMQISIHALRMERDIKQTDALCVYCISIHALRMERDHAVVECFGGMVISIHALRMERDVHVTKTDTTITAISIHALRMERDIKQLGLDREWVISIHALRMERDALPLLM